MRNTAVMRAGRGAMLDALVAAGWPAGIGLNDRKTTSHTTVLLDGFCVHVFWSKTAGWGAFDPGIKAAFRADTRDAVLLKLLSARRFPSQDDASNVSGQGLERTDSAC